MSTFLVISAVFELDFCAGRGHCHNVPRVLPRHLLLHHHRLDLLLPHLSLHGAPGLAMEHLRYLFNIYSEMIMITEVVNFVRYFDHFLTKYCLILIPFNNHLNSFHCRGLVEHRDVLQGRHDKPDVQRIHGAPPQRHQEEPDHDARRGVLGVRLRKERSNLVNFGKF